MPKDAEVGLNKELSVECDAIGVPSPTIEWFKHTTPSDRQFNLNGEFNRPPDFELTLE